jgi:nitrogen fixation/metabolism regulation signal transduction histidine kinase
VSFLLLAGVPSLLVTISATRRMSDAIATLQNPGVGASFDHAATLYGELVDHLRFDAELVLDWLPTTPPGADDEPLVRDLLEQTGFDFAAYETASGSTYLVTATGAAFEGTRTPTAADWTTLAAGGRPDPRHGRTLAFFRVGREGESARAVGVVLGPELAVALSSAGDDFRRYQQLEIVEQVRKRWFWILSAAIFLVAAAAAFVVARITARRISRPVVELAAAADRIAAGDLTQRADVRADGEIGDLVGSFNRMGERLERSRAELVRVERVAAWRDVARRIAHEVRNPLTPIKLAIHRLDGRLPHDPEARECLRSIDEEVDSLARISEAFSDFAKLPAPRFESADLVAIVRSVRELFLGSEELEVVYEGPSSAAVVADRDQLRRAVTNLVKNASEAMNGAGTIRLEVSSEGGGAKLVITDDGPGIPAQIRDTLLEPGVSGKPGGSGLGLAMVHRIATDHQGTLKWESTDRGTRFVLEFPSDLQVST